VPLNAPHDYERTKGFARALGGRLAREHPDHVTDRSARALRARKVLVDWAQNAPGRSTVAPYSPRATDRPSISTPVSWDEVEGALAAGRPELLSFTPEQVIDRVERDGDLFADVANLQQALPRV
jgi:bifunctional non-homologous end joining protein LigD